MFYKIKTGVNKLFNLFKTIDEPTHIDDSVIVQDLRKQQEQKNLTGLNAELHGIGNFNAYYGIGFDAVDTNKVNRLRTYRLMANHPDIGYCFDEHASSFLSYDENGEFIGFEYDFTNHAKELNTVSQTEINKVLNKEFKKFIELFEFDENIDSYIYKFSTEGELVWENIVKPDELSLGIVGVQELKNEDYEYMVDSKNKELIGLAFNNQSALAPMNMTSEMGKNATFTSIQTPSYRNMFNQYTGTKDKDFIPLPWSQVTYACTGNFNAEKTMVFPILEKIRKTYVQLSLLEECAIVYRVARSPERLVFNVSTGKLPRQKADQELLKMMLRFRNRKGGSVDNGAIHNRYDAVNAMESYFFAKPDGSEGTTVDKLSGSASFSELEDIEYFLKKLYKGLNVPYARAQDAQTEFKGFSGPNSSITHDEYRFAKYIIKIQRSIASALKDSFIVHLKLTGLYEKFSLKSEGINIRFTRPSLFDLYVEQQQLKIKYDNYQQMANQQEFSKTYLMRKCLQWDNEEIKNNQNERIKDAVFEARLNKIIEKYGGSVPHAPGGLGPAMPDVMGGLPGDSFDTEKMSELPSDMEELPEIPEEPAETAPEPTEAPETTPETV